jgi:hypothetical protein
MLKNIVGIFIIILGLHTLLKFSFFFLLPYSRRRAALDRAYGNKPTATRVADIVLLSVAVVLAALLLVTGIDATSFLGGLWIGGTLIQLYFHRFHLPLNEKQAPQSVVSPIKMMSYAIQAAPGRPWREILFFAILVDWSLVLIIFPRQ